ncbi:hypothetical protein DTO027B5_3997 [Paecilomyces variotii]|nr:hypothetical protein DTO195F2_1544 [Paecilomyces variotii]KAJ9291795.1 hypothetical protein DTO021C3_696 [Paecilomyces variotii]KAJ9321206.1 hypothetical protein DTO027B3_7778 [Paecilomyces variotii]KAJ9334289.1 hypothetical protein DTO027B5_3997 [Paecilomyces variotii]KAJ9368255.1 hypothetical protein DTO282E5_7065 [Paecilomyces variotii]
MSHPGIANIVPELSDLELAVFVCLASQEHCLIETQHDGVDDLAKELALISSSTFGLSYALLDCSSGMSLDDFSGGILASATDRSEHHPSTYAKSSDYYPSFRSVHDTRSARTTIGDNYLDERKTANVVIAKNFNDASVQVQIQALELLRSGRIFTRNAVHSTPAAFIFIPVVSSRDEKSRPKPLNKHLNDHIFISHFHDPQDGYPNLEGDDSISDDQASISSVVRKPNFIPSKRAINGHAITREAIAEIRHMCNSVTVSAEVARYLQDIVVFLRLNRAVLGGISAKATNHLLRLSKCLASLHGLDYVTPSIVALAAKKVYRHRITVVSPEQDRSLLYGSDEAAVSKLLKGVTPDIIIENVLGDIEAPL